MSDPLAALAGEVLGDRYRVEERVGAGGMSVVFRARDLRLDRPVALKVVAPAAAAEPRARARERFRREAASAARLPPHPNVVPVYDYGTDEARDLDFIAMELVPGPTLREAMAREALPRGRAVRHLLEVARGLAAGHRAGVVHRDVKPANVVLAGPGADAEARLLDFGIAKPVEADPRDDLTRTGQVAYSPAYASPEQLRGERAVTPASDVYQLGLVAYEALTGERPFDAQDRDRIRAGAAVELPARGAWDAVPAPLRAVVARALRTEPGERFADAAEMAEALAAAQAAPAPARERTVTHAVPAVPPAEGGAAGAPPPPRRRPHAELPGWMAPPPLGAWTWPLALVLLLGLVLVATRGGDGEDREGGLAPLPPVAASSAGGEDGGEDEGPTTFREDDRPRIEDELRAKVEDLNRAWVEGDLDRHVSHYASRVDYYDSERLARAGVLRDRRRDLRRYPQREIRLDDVRFEWLEPGRVRALVRKSWRFAGPERGEREGSGLQEYVFKRDEDDGEWYVVAERLLEQTERRVAPGAEG